MKEEQRKSREREERKEGCWGEGRGRTRMKNIGRVVKGRRRRRHKVFKKKMKRKERKPGWMLMGER